MTNACQAMPPACAWPVRSTNGCAIAAFVLSLLGWFFLSIPFGFVALHQIKNRGEDGRGMAIAGLVISAVSIIALVGMILIPLFIWTTTATPIHHTY